MLAYSAVAGNPSSPDYELAERIALTSPSQVKAISHPLRTTILGLLHERAATVTELAVAVERPKSTVAHHVKVLTEAGLVQVVRTRRVRAIEERFYGRTARMFYVGVERSPNGDDLPLDFNDFEVAARESDPAYRDGKLWGFIRHARISEEQASEFWERMSELVAEFDQLPRSGETVYGFAVGVYPTEHPRLPSRDDEDAARLVTRPRRTDATAPRQTKPRKSKQSRDE
jgi:DNA-binding transcriptional ArsR family regulator